MKAREVIKKIMEEQNVKCAKVARAMGTSTQNVYNKLYNDKVSSDLKLDTLIAMANYLDYDVCLVPKTRSDLIGGAILSNEE